MVPIAFLAENPTVETRYNIALFRYNIVELAVQETGLNERKQQGMERTVNITGSSDAPRESGKIDRHRFCIAPMMDITD
jgi:hypothetical protein